MESIINLLIKSANQVWVTFLHNWPFLIASVAIAVGLKLYINPEKVSAFLMRHRKKGIYGATVAAVATPLCSCGTTAIILGMMATTIPWSPIIAFMVASPLTSPEELIYSAGIFGWPFAIFFFVSSIVLGLMGGFVGEIFEKRGWFANQSRYASPTKISIQGSQSESNASDCNCRSQPVSIPIGKSLPTRNLNSSNLSPVFTAVNSTFKTYALESSNECAISALPSTNFCECSDTVTGSYCREETNQSHFIRSDSRIPRGNTYHRSIITPKIVALETLKTGKRLLLMFLGYAFIGYFINSLIPAEWVARIFGEGNMFSVPLAAILGLPLYINTEASLPLVRALIDGGMSQGAAMAFLITGAGTSIGAITGALSIARWRIIGTVIGTLVLGSTLMGYLYNILIVAGIF